MMHEGSLAVRFFDLILCCILADPEHFVVIFPLTLLQLQLCVFQQMLVILRNTMEKKKSHMNVSKHDRLMNQLRNINTRQCRQQLT